MYFLAALFHRNKLFMKNEILTKKYKILTKRYADDKNFPITRAD